MNYIDEIFSRADIQQICGFLAHGAECMVMPGTFKERIETAEKKTTVADEKRVSGNG